jgi:hypothetical protein
MSSEILFEEVQSSGKKSVRDFTGGMSAIFLVSLVLNLLMRKGQFNGFTALLLVAFCFSVLVWLACYIKMITQIRTDGIYVRFIPFQFYFSRYEWSDVLDVYVREFDPLSEYMGWGIRFGPLGKAYILSGRTGIQIVFKNKKRLLISTTKPEEMREILYKIMKDLRG